MIHNISSNKFCLIGYLLSEIGLGQAARYLAHALKSANINTDLVNMHISGKSNDREFIDERVRYVPGNINFIHAGLDSVTKCFKSIEKFGLGKKNYFYPAWELDRVPHSFIMGLELYDEIIAPTKFIADALKIPLGRSIKVISQPVAIPEVVQENKIKNSVLRVYSLMDFDSFSSRKNPRGVLDAFQSAFPAQFKDVELILKVRGERDNGSREMLQSYCARDSRIKVIDKTLTRSEVDMLMNECNVFLSMHRSEGFGLGPAEALASEKIVVSTDYGGTTDFINQSTGYPVEYKLVPLKPNDYWQWDKQIWADPSIDSAAIALRNIYDHYHDALIRAKNGRKFMKDHHSFEVIGRQMKDLL